MKSLFLESFNLSSFLSHDEYTITIFDNDTLYFKEIIIKNDYGIILKYTTNYPDTLELYTDAANDELIIGMEKILAIIKKFIILEHYYIIEKKILSWNC